MKYLLTLFLLISLEVFATSQIQIHAIKKDGVLLSYEVYTWNGDDKKMLTTKYSISEAQAKFGKLLQSGEAGTSKTPDRVIINFNDDGSIYKVDFQVLGTFEAVLKSNSQLSTQAKTDATTGKVDIETKTGKSIKGN